MNAAGRGRVPHRRGYRAFPELNALSDEQCVAFVRQARRQDRRAGRVRRVLAGVLVAIVLAPMLAVMLWSLDLFPVHRRYDWIFYLTFVVWMGPLSAPILLLAWWFSFREDRLVIGRRFRAPRCSACAYALSGLSQRATEVRCPECGSREMVGEVSAVP